MTYVAFLLGLVAGAGAFYAASLYFCLCVMRRENLEAVIGILLKDKAERQLGMSFKEAEAAEAAFRSLKAEQDAKDPLDGWREITA